MATAKIRTSLSRTRWKDRACVVGDDSGPAMRADPLASGITLIATSPPAPSSQQTLFPNEQSRVYYGHHDQNEEHKCVHRSIVESVIGIGNGIAEAAT